MIELITGAPGAGKSFFAVKKILASVEKGRVVVTNVPLREDWAEVIASRGYHKWKGEEHVRERRERFERLVFVSEDLNDLLRVRVEGDSEGRADMVLDECHRWLNARMWDSGLGESREEATRNRLKLVGFFSAHRHYGYDIFLITQDPNNIDRQIRTLFEYLVRLKNLKRVKVFGIPLLPVNLFVAIRTWNDRVQTKISVSTYGLDKTVARLYSTHAMAVVDMPEDVIMMPRKPGDGGARASHGAVAPRARDAQAGSRTLIPLVVQPSVNDVEPAEASSSREDPPWVV